MLAQEYFEKKPYSFRLGPIRSGPDQSGPEGLELEVQDQAGEKVLSLGHNCVAASLTAFLWTEDLRVPEIPGERQG